MKLYTDLEQSERLIKILPLDSADMALCSKVQPLMTDYISAKKKFSNAGEISIDPCWSLAALLDLLPSEIIYFGTTYEIQIRKYSLTKGINLHQIAYGNVKIDVDGQFSFKDMVNTGEKENLVDACVQMIIELNKMNLL